MDAPAYSWIMGRRVTHLFLLVTWITEGSWTKANSSSWGSTLILSIEQIPTTAYFSLTSIRRRDMFLLQFWGVLSVVKHSRFLLFFEFGFHKSTAWATNVTTRTLGSLVEPPLDRFLSTHISSIVRNQSPEMILQQFYIYFLRWRVFLRRFSVERLTKPLDLEQSMHYWLEEQMDTSTFLRPIGEIKIIKFIVTWLHHVRVVPTSDWSDQANHLWREVFGRLIENRLLTSQYATRRAWTFSNRYNVDKLGLIIDTLMTHRPPS